MKLFVCWGTFPTVRPGGHPCANAHNALTGAGYDPEVVKVRGLGIGPGFMHWTTDGRREVRSSPARKLSRCWSPTAAR